MKSHVVGMIPARGGSKSIPKKNIAPLAGKPLIAWAIETVRRSAALSCVIVSPDDTEIAKAARIAGGEVYYGASNRQANLTSVDEAHHSGLRTARPVRPTSLFI